MIMSKNMNENTIVSQQPKPQSSQPKQIYGVYIDSILTKKIVLSITEIGKNIKENILKKIASFIEGKCIEEGFIRPNSIKIIKYSCGIVNTENIEFQVVFQCKICFPVEGMIIECIIKTITKAGVHAEVLDYAEGVVPINVFIIRDHHFMDNMFQNLKENDKIIVKVIGIRFELNDPYINVIGKLDFIRTRELTAPPKKPRLIIQKTKGGAKNEADSDDSDADDDGDVDADDDGDVDADDDGDVDADEGG
jgi:DNA-directed RNA polymerase subunit E'/Rpb7